MARNTITWTLLYVLCTTLHKTSQASYWRFPQEQTSSSNDLPARYELSCHGYPMMITCPGVDVIKVIKAEYGRLARDICSGTTDEVANTQCSLDNALDIVSRKCNNKTVCNIQVTSDNFPDPCRGTRKYLRTTFECVRYLFNCPGTFTGIGEAIPSVIDIKPQSATWTKDPLDNVDYVYMVVNGNTLKEYTSWSNFELGIVDKTYTLPSRIAGENFVVYDRSVYFFREKTHRLVRYSLRSQKAMKTVEIVDMTGGVKRKQNMTLSVDEQGLWVVYTRGNGAMTVRKLHKDRLVAINTWVTNRRRSQYRFTFMICGVLYGVDKKTGKAEFSYNTNVPTDRERFSFHDTPNSFFEHNPATITYNPREQMIYSWDAVKGIAINYKLHFNAKSPVTAPTPTADSSGTTASPIRGQQQGIMTRTNASITTTTTTTEPTPPHPDGAIEPVAECHSVSRAGIEWPDTAIGEIARMECPSRRGEFATWRCERDSSMVEADWHIAGPDVSRCSTWVAKIDQQFKSGVIVVSTAFKSLADELKDETALDVPVPEITGLVQRLLEHSTVPSQEEARSVVESVATISGKILNNEKAMGSLSDEKKSTVAVSLMNATEKASFLYADIIARNPSDSWEADSIVVSSDEVVTEIRVRERVFNLTELSGMTSFPGEKTCKEIEATCGYLIEIPTTEIMSQRGAGPALVVFALYNNLSQYLDSSSGSDWEVDSRIISATLQEQNYQTSLQSPAIITLRHNQPSSGARRCVYWNFQASNGKGNWSDHGCVLKSGNTTHTVCECDHLTSFAVLVNHAGVEIAEVHDTALDIITKVGISISIVCLVLCIVTFCYFRNLHSDRTSVHKHLCICLLVAETLFLFGIGQTGSPTACSVIAGLLHYFFLAAFMWMAVEGFMLYVMLVEIFEAESRWKWYYLFGYGLPAVIVGISAAVDRSGYGTDDACWLSVDSGFIWSFVGPVLVIIIANLGFLSIAVYKMYVHSVAFTDIGKINSVKASVRGASVLLFLLGITWTFGILWINENMAILAYLFCIFNAFQGMFIFIFHCVLPRKVRQEYRRFFSRLTCCEDIGRSSYLSNSSSFSKQYPPRRYPAGSGLTSNVTLQQSQLRRMWTETVAPRNSDEVVTSEISSNGELSHTVVSLNRSGGAHHPADRNYLQEDEVFLPPPSHDARNKLILNRPRNDAQYDRLQRHYHPDDYLIFPGEARPLGDFSTGKVPQRDHFGNIIESEHQTPRMGIRNLTKKPITPANVRDVITGDSVNPRNWNSRRPMQNHAHPFRRSLDENFNGKRDSGIVLQRHPSLSGIQSNYKVSQRSMDNVLADFHSNESDYGGNPNPVENTRSHRLSLDSIQRSGISGANYRLSPPRQSTKHTAFQSKPLPPFSGNKKRKSLSSDSDDPIVTDCSVSSACSSAGNQMPMSTLSEVTNSKYEEPMCRKTHHHHHNVSENRCHDRLHKYRHSDPTDENDLEVELLTNADGFVPRHDTLGHPPYRPPTPPHSNNPPISNPRTLLNQRSDFYRSHEFHPPRHQRHGFLISHNVSNRAITGL